MLEINDLYYIYKDKYNEGKDGLNTQKSYYRKLRLTDDYQYESEKEEEEEEKQQTSKKPDKKEPRKKSTKDNASNFNEWVNRKEAGINSEMSQEYFKYQRPSDMLKDLYRINDKKKNSKLLHVIKSGLSDSKNETENMGEKKRN